MITERVRKLASVVAVLALVAGLVVAAIRADGYDEPEFDLHDAAIWATRLFSGGGEIGRVNTELAAIDVRLAASGARFDVVQEGPVVLLVEPDNGMVKAIDLRGAANPVGSEVEIPKGADVKLGGGTLAVADPAAGAVHIGAARPNEPVAVNPKAALKLDAPFTLAVGVDGIVHVLVPDKRLLVHLDEDGAVKSRTQLPGDVDPTATVSAVGTRAIVADPANSRLLVDGGKVQEIAVGTGGKALVVQQPGASADTVLFATDEVLAEADLGGGAPRTLADGGTGSPAEPVRIGRCRFGAWSSSPRYAQVCGSERPHAEPVTIQSGEARLRFRTNRDRVILNEVRGGQVHLLLDGDPQIINDWEKALRPEDAKSSATSDSGKVEITPAVRDLLQQQENRPPVAVDDQFGVRPGLPSILSPLRNDSDPNGDLLTLTSVTAGVEGWAFSVVQGQRAIQASPPEFATTGSAQVRYAITDGRGGTADATVTVNIRPADQNGQPVARPDRMVVEVGGRGVADVLVNDDDPDGDPLTLRSAVAPSGTVQFRPEGQVTFQAPSTPGEVAVEYTVVDGHGGAAVQRLTVEVVRKANVAPVAIDDRAATTVGRSIAVDVLANDTDVNNDTLRVVSLSQVPGVTANWTPAGIVRITPQRPGTLDYVYEITDGQASDKALLRIAVTDPKGNSPPIAVVDRVQVRPGLPAAVDLLVNDRDEDGDVLVIQGVEAPPAAPLSLELLDRRVLRVTASQPLESPVALRYSVSDGRVSAKGTVYVIPDSRATTNQPPAPVEDEVTVRVGNVTSIPVLDNDLDPDGDDLTILSVEKLAEGDGLLVSQQRELRYQAPAVPRGGVRATYTVVDSSGNRADGTVLIRVTASDRSENRAPEPPLIEARTIQNHPVAIPIRLVGMDPEGDVVTVGGLVDPPARGTVAQDKPDRFVYEPDRNESGSDRFTYRVRDTYGAEGIGVVLVGIAPPAARNSPPVAAPDRTTVTPGGRVRVRVLENDTDPDGDEIRFAPDEPLGAARAGKVELDADGTAVTFDAAGLAAGTEVVFDYGITDGRGGLARGLVTVLVTDQRSQQLPPIARDDVVAAQPRRSALAVEVLANDEDPDGERNGLQVALGPGGSGAARVEAGGKVTIDVGDAAVSLVYTITDPQGLTASAIVQVPVLPESAQQQGQPNRSPIASPDRSEVKAGESVTIDVLANDDDPDGDALRIAAILEREVPRGRAEIVDNKVRFTADTNAEGTGGFNYRVTDGESEAIGTASVVIAGPTNRPPTATGLTLDVPAGASASVDLSRAVKDPDPEDNHTFSSVGGGAEGVTATLGGSTLEVRAAANAFGRTARFTYTVSDGSAEGTATGTVDVRVTSSNRPPPKAVPDAASGPSTAPLVIDVLANDVDPVADGLTIVGITPPLLGGAGGRTVGSAQNSGNRITYAPEPGFFGIVRFSYTVRDVTDQPDRRSTAAVDVTVYAPPGAAGAPQGSPTDSGVALTWAASSPNGSPITEYILTRSPGGVETRHSSTSATLTGLNNGTSYTFTVRAVNAAGQGPASPASAAVIPNTLPEIPEPPTVRFGDQSISVTWVAPANRGTPITGYLLEISTGARQTVTGTSYNWTGLANGTPYRFRVAAINAASDPQKPQFSALSAEESPADVPLRPAAPVGSRGDGSISLTWSAPASNGAPLLEYEIRPYAGGTAQAVVKEPNPSSTSRSMTGLNNGTSYEFDIRARNKASWSEWSPRSAAVTPATTPAATGAPTASNGDDRATTLSFPAPANDGGSAITGYKVSINGGSTQALPVDRIVTGLTNGTQYRFQVQACNTVGCGPLSADSNTITPVGIPAVPVVSGSVSSTRITWNWNVPNGNGAAITGYEYRIDGGTAQSTTATTYTAEPGWGQTRTLEVRAINGASKTSAWGANQQTTPSPVPNAPGVSGSISGTTINWSWTEPSGNGAPITGYEFRINGGGVQSTTGRSFSTDPGYSQSRTIEVRSVNAAGNRSGWAANQQTTPPPPIVVRATWTVNDAFINGAWSHTGTGNAAYGRSNQIPGDGVQWYPNGSRIDIECTVRGAAYTVQFIGGTSQTWNWWAKTTAGTYMKTAVFNQVNQNGSQGIPC